MATKCSKTLYSLPLLLLFLPYSASQSPVKAGYWAAATEFPVSSIDSSLFTHLYCAFATLDPTTHTLSIPPSFSSFTSTVRSKNPSVSTLLSIGGGSANSSAFSSMASQPSTRSTFIQSSISLARSNNFQGLDLDWEYPTSESDMSNFATLLSEWRSAIRSESASSGKPPLLLTAAVSFSNSVNGLIYPVNSISANLDWVNVMAYDFYAPSRTHVTSAHAALYDSSGGPSGSAGIGAWENAKLAGSKIVFGIPYYGYAWKLVDPANHGLGAGSSGPATGPGIDSDAAIGFGGVRNFEAVNGAAREYDGTVVADYCYAGTTWIGYDDVEAVGAKVEFAKNGGLRGYFAWSVSGDDGNWTLSKKALSTWG